MAVRDTGEEAPSDEVRPSIGVDPSTGKTEAGLAGEADPSGLSACHAAVLDEAHLFRIATVQHLLDGFGVLIGVETGIGGLEIVPVLQEDSLERADVDAVPGHGRSILGYHGRVRWAQRQAADV